MPYLIAAVVVVGVLCLFNLLLLYGVIRRLRTQPEHHPAGIARAGSVVGAFTAATTEGTELTAEDLLPDTLVGFFSPGCSACVGELPKFVDLAAGRPQDRVLAVVVGPETAAAEQVSQLEPKAQVVVAQLGAEIVRAFDVQGYPSFAVVGADRELTTSGAAIQAVG